MSLMWQGQHTAAECDIPCKPPVQLILKDASFKAACLKVLHKYTSE